VKTVADLMSGATIALIVMVALHFLRYHRTTRDRLFLVFALAFFVLGVNRLALSFWEDDETRTYLYLVRLCAYLLILYGIWDKNRVRRGGAEGRQP
jgi:hypothetical protein